jgi:hypothetical protein
METVIENVELVKQKIKFAGFGEYFNKEIDTRIAAGATEFKLITQRDVEKGNMLYELEVNIKDKKAYYNGFAGTLTDKSTGESVRQWFPSKDNVTSREAVQLLWDKEMPRAVHKQYFDDQGERYGTWLQLNFNELTESGNHKMMRYSDKFGFNLENKLNDFTFQELSDSAKVKEMVKIMEKGGEAVVTPSDTSRYSNVYISANPEKGTINIVDEKGKYLPHDLFRTEEARQQAAEKREAYLRENIPPSAGEVQFTHNGDRRYNPREVVVKSEQRGMHQ